MMTLSQSLILIIGILLTSGLFYLILYFGFQRRIALLSISLFCFCQAAKALFRTDATLAMDFLGMPNEEAAIYRGIVYTLGNFFLITFLVFHLHLPKKALLVGTTLGLILLFYAFHWSQLPLALGIGIGIAAYAFPNQKLGSTLVILGLLIFGATTYFEVSLINKVGYFIGIISFIILITIFIGYQITQQIREQKMALLRSSTLGNQLLKKSLQPHFLFNSLMSLQEWIETSPKDAAHFVQVLADEFRSVCRMSGNQLISMEEELAMCRSHLAIMGFRKQASFHLETHGITGDESVPPAIFHTLVENGLTHGYSNRDQGHFVLTKSILGNEVRYTLFNDSHITGPGQNSKTGTGLKYVEARLEESFPGSWTLESGPVEGGWQVNISLKGAAIYPKKPNRTHMPVPLSQNRSQPVAD